MDVIGSTAFGIRVNSQEQPDDPFVKHAKELTVAAKYKFHLPCEYLENT